MMLARLGHCISYDKVSEIETAQAELVEHFQSMSLSLPLQPAGEGKKVCILLRSNYLVYRIRMVDCFRMNFCPMKMLALI